MARDLTKVINQMLAVIPYTEVSLIRALESVQSSAAFSAPEIMGVRWKRCAEVLSHGIPVDPNRWLDWQREVILIWTDEKKIALIP